MQRVQSGLMLDATKRLRRQLRFEFVNKLTLLLTLIYVSAQLGILDSYFAVNM